MHALKSLGALTMLSLLLTGCGPRQAPEVAAGNNRQLAARCPTPGNLTGSELRSLASTMTQPGAPKIIARVAGEYDRLDDESIACRG